MKRTNLVLDEEVLQEAVRVLGTKTYSATVNLALKEALRMKRIQGLADHIGKVAWLGDLSQMRGDSGRQLDGDRWMVLVDTSVWIELFAGRVQARPDDFLNMATCGPVIQEVLLGLRPGKHEQQIRWQLLGLPRLGDPLAMDVFLEATDLYVAAKRRGLRVRSSIDCQITSIAIRHKTPIWHRDRDFGRIAAFTWLETWTPSQGRLA